MWLLRRDLCAIWRGVLHYESVIPMKIRNDCFIIEYSWVKYFASLHLHTNLQFEDQMKTAKLMSQKNNMYIVLIVF